MFETTLNPIFSPLLNLSPFWSILIISLIIAVIMTYVYKWMTDQHLMKALKDDIKALQKEMKEFKEDPARVMALQKKAMEANMKYMMHSMKPTLITFIPIIIIFGWLSANLAYAPIMPDVEFTTTAMFKEGASGAIDLKITPEGIDIFDNSTKEISGNSVSWKLKGKEGSYTLEYNYNGKPYLQELLITKEQAYKPPVITFKDSELKALQINNQPLKAVNLFGWKIGWLGSYIIFSLIFSMALRKMLKLH